MRNGSAAEQMSPAAELHAERRPAAALCAIHQPNFFPWCGFFDKVRRADVFVLLDAVAYPRAGSGGMGSWTNRVRINVQGQPHWLGCPVAKYQGTRKISEVRIAEGGKWRERLLRTLQASYGRSPGYARAMELLQPLIENPTDILADYNVRAITTISNALGLDCRFVRQSEIGSTEASTRLLVELVQKVGARAYLAGGGASGYQEDALFAAEGLELVSQNFAPLPYGRAERFLPGLSIIDFLMESADWRQSPGARVR